MVNKELIKKILAKAYIWLMLILMYLPILVLIIFSFTESDEVGVWTGFSFGLYGRLFQNHDLLFQILIPFFRS